MKKGLISCVLPTYNGEEFLARSIESVLGQSYENFELIIIDDASTDATADIAQGFAAVDSRVRYYKNATNQKLPRSLNIGFSHAVGEFFTWTSDDNEFKKDAFAKMSGFLRECENAGQNVGLVCCDYDVSDGGAVSVCRVSDELARWISASYCACFLYRADTARAVGEYDVGRFLAEDYDFFLRMGLACGLGCINESLYLYRRQPKSLSSTRGRAAAAMSFRVRREWLPKYLAAFPRLYDDIAGLENRAKYRIYAATLDERIWAGFAGDFGGQERERERERESNRRAFYEEMKHAYAITREAAYLRAIGRLGGIYALKKFGLKLRKFK